jgi:signal peptidase I
MFGFFASQETKMRRNAANWLELADKVWALRRDVLPAPEAANLARKRDALRAAVKAKADAAKLKLLIEDLEGSLRQSGGAVYPKTALIENIEFFLVAAIVILGIRTYFVQPFKIPTNSMWPTYHGMTAENLPPNQPAPGPAARWLRLVAMGATRHEATAPRSGTVTALFINRDIMAFTKKRGRTWLIFPTAVREYTFYVDGVATSVEVPMDFGRGPEEHAGSFEDLVIDTFFGNRTAFNAYWDKVERERRYVGRNFIADAYTGQQSTAAEVALGQVEEGKPVLRFDILTGDQLFVDRFSYHFFRPAPGQGFVFRTDHIPRINSSDYYIKRLVGLPGDTIELHPPQVYRNGQPITGAEAFTLNAQRVAPYTGYTDFPKGGESAFPAETTSIKVPERSFFAMGDNSSNSSDGRYWGFVPADDVIGRPIFIYYPFTRRWGLAR